MNRPLIFSPSDFASVTEHFKTSMRFYPTAAEIRVAFSKVTALVPDSTAVRRTRQLLAEARPEVLRAICDKMAKTFDVPPTTPQIQNSLAMLGHTASVRICDEIRHFLSTEYADRWNNMTAKRKVRRIELCEGDDMMLATLKDLYNLDFSDTVSLLLRVLAMSAQAGKFDYLEAPFIAASLKSDDMKKYAKALNFTIPKTTMKRRR